MAASFDEHFEYTDESATRFIIAPNVDLIIASARIEYSDIYDSQSPTFCSDISAEQTVNPWDIEYRPNPVIFPEPFELETSLGPMELLQDLLTELSCHSFPANPHTMWKGNSDHSINVGSQNSSSTVASPRAITAASTTAKLCLQSEDISPLDCIVWLTVSERKVKECFEVVEFIANIQSDKTLRTTKTTIEISPEKIEDSQTAINICLNADCDSSHAPTSTPSSTLSSSSTSPQTNDNANKCQIASPQYVCTDCSLEFQTPGLLRSHHNRKYNLRYACSTCSRAFGLQADLKRHERSVHQDPRFPCPNPGCNKTFTREDNLPRHIKGCRKASAKGKAAASPPLELE